MAGNRVISAVLTLKDKNFSATAKKSASAVQDFQRKTQHSSNTVRSFGKSATSSFKSVAAGAASIAAAIGVTKALSGAFNMVRSSVGDAMDRIDTMEQFERVMGVMVDDTDKVTATMDRLNTMLEGTSMRTDVMSKGIQNFVTRGVEIEKATDYMEAFGNAVSFYGDGSSEQFDSVTDALQTMVATGKVDMQQMNRVMSAGIPATEIYADAVGKSTKTVEEELSKGAVSAEEFVSVVSDALMEGTDKFPEVSTAMRDAGSSWKSVMANIGAYASQGMTKVVTAIDEALENNNLPTMREMLDNFGQSFGNLIGGVADKVPLATEYLVGMYEAAQPGIDWMISTGFPGIQDGVGFAVDKARDMYNFFSENWPLISPIIAGVTAGILTYKAAVTAVAIAQGTWKLVTSGLTLAQAGLNAVMTANPIGLIVVAIGSLVAAGVALYQNWDWVKEKALQLWQVVQDNPFLAIAAGPFGVLITAGVKLYQNFDKIKAAFDRFKNAISKFKLPGWVSTVGGALSRGASAVGNFIAGSHATGLNRVPYDGYIAELHKDEMVVPATQSRNLRKQGLNIDNVDKGTSTRTKSRRPKKYTYQTTSVSNSDLPQLIDALMKLIQLLSNMPKGDTNININGTTLTVEEIINELVPLLKLRMANM